MEQQDNPQNEVQQQQSQATTTTGRHQMQERPEECGVCLFVYDEQEHRPLTLPCGHTFCHLCVAARLEDGGLACPSCLTDHLAPSADHFPVSYVIEAMVRKFQAAKQVTGGASSAAGEASLSTPRDSQASGVKRKHDGAAGLSKKMQSIIQEHQTSTGSLATTLQQELDQLNQFRAQLSLYGAEHGCQVEELDKLAQKHRAATELLQEEDARVEALVEKGQEVQREIRAAQGQMEQVSTILEVVSTIHAADHTTVEAEEWLQHSREQIPNSNALGTSHKVMKVTKAALEVARAKAMATSFLPTSGHLDCSIMEVVEILSSESLQLVDLGSMWLRKRLEAGKVFAVQEYEGGTRYSSKITLDGDKILLHALKEELPPLGSHILKVSKAMEDIDYNTSSVFLNLSWPGMPSHRIHIRLQADTPLTRQFVALSLGHTGLTYHSTKFLHVEHLFNSRIMWGGDISGQRAEKGHHLPPLQAEECGDRVQGGKGMVVVKLDLSNIVQNTQFGLVIGGGGGGCKSHYNTSYYCLGQLEASDVSTLEAAFKKKGAMNAVQVVDCGIVFSP